MLEPHDKQREIIQSPARYKIIRAGRKGGKSAMEVENIVFLSVVSADKLNLTKTLFRSGRKIIYVAPTQTQARDIVWSLFRNRLNGLAKFNEQRLEIKVPNEDGDFTTIMVGGWENRENYRGLADVIHITFDEVDTLKNFFISYQEIFRPMFLDTGGTANFIGTPKKENPNLKRLEKQAEKDPNYACFHFTSKDNPFLSPLEIDEMEREYADNREGYRQEVLAEYVENTGALFRFSSLVDVFSNTIDKEDTKYLIVDIAEDGSDKTIFSFWEGLEEYRRESFSRLSTENIVDKIREYASQDRIPYSNIAVDAIGVGVGVASSSMLDGIISFKSSYGAIKTDEDPVKLPNVHYTKHVPLTTEYRNLRSQCIFTLADLVNNHKIASKLQGQAKERIIEELSLYQDASIGDGKRFATPKEDIKESLGRSPDDSDTWIMRMYFVIRDRMMPDKGPEYQRILIEQANLFMSKRNNQEKNSTR